MSSGTVKGVLQSGVYLGDHCNRERRKKDSDTFYGQRRVVVGINGVIGDVNPHAGQTGTVVLSD